MAGNYKYITKDGDSTKDPEKWAVGMFERRYIATYCKFGFRQRSAISEPSMTLIFDRVFSLKAWGIGGYK